MSAHDSLHVIRFVQTLWGPLHAAVDMGTGMMRIETNVKVLCTPHINFQQILNCVFFIDINECEEAARDGIVLCAENSICRNTPGSYNCACFRGYARINGTCQRQCQTTCSVHRYYFNLFLQLTSHAKMEVVALIFAHLLTVVHSVPVQRVII